MPPPSCMFEIMPEELIKSLLGQGPLVVSLVIAITWFNSTQKETNSLLFKERDARLNSMDEHIKQLEARSQACETDRIRLYQMAVQQEHRISVLAAQLAGVVETPPSHKPHEPESF